MPGRCAGSDLLDGDEYLFADHAGADCDHAFARGASGCDEHNVPSDREGR